MFLLIFPHDMYITWYTHTHTHIHIYTLFLDFYLFLDSGEGREERERNINVRLPLVLPLLGDLASNLDMCPENWTGDPLVYIPEFNSLSHTIQGHNMIFYNVN